MGILHVAPTASAGQSLSQTIEASGRDDQVIRHPDDLSCGPIASDDPSSRSAWWEQVFEEPAHSESLTDDRLASFWDRVATTDDNLVVWFGRHSAEELAFFLAFAHRVGDRSYDAVDVTGVALSFTHQDGSPALRSPAQAASQVPPYRLKSLLDRRRPVTPAERDEAGRRWRGLKRENAPFRVVAEDGLVSAPVDHFDGLLLGQLTHEWHTIAWVVGCTMGNNSDPYRQVGDLMLLTRVVALVSEGKLLADGDPWDMRACRVRLPG